MQPRKLADGSGGGRNSYESACVRAIDAHLTLGKQADRVIAELDHITAPGVIGAVSHQMSADDSLVIAIQELTSACDETTDDDTGKKP